MRDQLSIQGHETESGEPDIVPPTMTDAQELELEFARLNERLELAAATLGVPAHIFDSPRGTLAESAADREWWNRGLDRIRHQMGLDL